MDNFISFFQNLPNTFLAFWETSSTAKKSLMVGGLLGAIGLFTVLFSINKEENLQNLYVNLSQNDLSSISNFLVKITLFFIIGKGSLPTSAILPEKIEIIVFEFLFILLSIFFTWFKV